MAGESKPDKGASASAAAQAREPAAAEEEIEVKMLNLATGEWGIYQAFGVYKMPAARALSFIKAGDAERI
jgi:hypothetical protein